MVTDFCPQFYLSLNISGNIRIFSKAIGLEQKFVVFSKISIFYKINMTPFDRAKFQLSESVLQIMV